MDVKPVEAFRKKFDKELKTGLLSMLVLLAIDRAKEPSYGYAIIKTLEASSGGNMDFPEGTVYPILNSFAERGFLVSSWGNPLRGPMRKYYRLTPDGREALRICIEDWRKVSKATEELMERMEVSA